MTNYYKQLQKQKIDMAKEAEEMAKSQEITTGKTDGDIDGFRHVYTSAKQTRDNGALYANVMGKANEIYNEVIEFGTRNMENPQVNPWQMDEHNNAVGRELGKRAKKENWTDERIAQEAKKLMDAGKVITNPDDKEGNKKKTEQFYKDRAGFLQSSPDKPEQREEQPSTSPDGFSGKGLPDVGDPEVKRQNSFSDEANVMLDQGARMADQLAEEIVADARKNPNANQGMIDKTKQNLAEMGKRLLVDLNVDDNDPVKPQIFDERPDLFKQPKLKPLADKDNDSVFDEMKKQVRAQSQNIPQKDNSFDMGDMIKNTINENMHRIKFDDQRASMESMFEPKKVTAMEGEKDLVKQVAMKFPKNPFRKL